jgi:hypothetical protein
MININRKKGLVNIVDLVIRKIRENKLLTGVYNEYSARVSMSRTYVFRLSEKILLG